MRAWPGRSIGPALAAVLVLGCASGAALVAQVRTAWPAGDVFVCGGGAMPAEVYEAFLACAGGPAARLVVIPTASASADQDDAAEHFLAGWFTRGVRDASLLHTRDRERADDVEFCTPLLGATAVWISGGDQARLAAAYVGTRCERELHAVLARGGVVGGTSAGAAIQSRRMIASGNPEPLLAFGLGLLDGLIVDQHFRQRQREARLVRALALADGPDLFGVGVDERTALWVHGRVARVLGEGGVTLVQAATDTAPASLRTVRRGSLIDLEQQRRIAGERRLGSLAPGARYGLDGAGALLLVGGGALPTAILERFVAAAGGVDAPIVVVPTAGETGQAEQTGAQRAEQFRGLGCVDVAVWHQPELGADTDRRRVAALERARGIWLCGGRQDRLVDAYADTIAVDAFSAVLTRGGVVGGTSAGTSIQAELLVRGHPLGNAVMLAPGYTRGFGFLRGTAVDQHFTQRGREPDLRAVVDRHPQVLGIGIDEGTALFVNGAQAEVLGGGTVTLLDARRGTGVVRSVFSTGAHVDLQTGRDLGR